MNKFIADSTWSDSASVTFSRGNDIFFNFKSALISHGIESRNSSDSSNYSEVKLFLREDSSQTPAAKNTEVDVDSQQRIMEFRRGLTDCLDAEIIDTCKKSPTEYYVERWLSEYPLLVQAGFGAVALESVGDPKRLVGLLNVITHADRDLFSPVNELIVLSCLSNKSTVVKEFAVGVYEYWADPKLVETLKHHELTPEWLDDYRKQVIADYCGE